MPAISRLAAALLGASATLAAHAATSAPFTPDDLVMLNRLADPQVSPDGGTVAYTLRSTDLAANRGNQDLWMLDIAHVGTTAQRLTSGSASDTSPRWSHDGKYLYFLSSRSGSSQVWRLPLAGGEAEQVTSLPLDVTALKVSPTEPRLVVAMDVVPTCADLDCTAKQLAAREKGQPSGRVYDQLFIRHWDRWEDGTVSHLFSIRVDAAGKAAPPVDLMAGMRANTPSRPDGGDEEFTFSRDGRSVVFAARLADRIEPWSTNFDLYQVGIDGGTARDLTADNPAWDTQPRFLADGSMAWLATARPGYESDRFRVMLRDAGGVTRELTRGWTLSAGTLAVARDGRTLLVSADDHGQVALFRIDPRHGELPQKLYGNGQITAFDDAPRGTVLALANLDAPADLFLLQRPGGEPSRLTAVNAALLDAREHAVFEQFSFAGADDTPVFGYVMKPAGYVEGRKYPVAFVIHGGPEVAFGNAWSFRWNPKTFAGAGYAVVFIDFHGTPGYGQDFTDAINGDWGGKPLLDLQRGLAAATAHYPFLDADRVCALGASYGGFMINWIAGNWPDRFRCLVSHDGIFDTRSMYYSTEELWFAEWENGGTYFDVAANHEKFNPSAHVGKWHTPMLVVHGGQDFRVPDTQGIATFTALQRRGIPSRLLYFPDENHWVLKPANSLQWHHEVLGWLDRYLKN